MRHFLSLFVILLVLSACNKEKIPLEGTREVVLLNENVLTPSETLKDLKVEVPAARLNRHWPQAGGEPDHSTPPLKLGKTLKTAWETSIGGGSHATGRLLAEPVVYNGRIFAFNTNAEVRALDAATGETLWEVSVVPENASGTSLGGGVAANDQAVYVTSPYAEVLALDSKSGQVKWRTGVNSPIRTPPSIKNGRVFVVTINNELEVLDAKTGAILWSHAGIMETAGLLGGAGPAVSSGVVVVPYTSGEIYALRVENGHTLWSDSLASFGKVDSISSLPHIRARPVIDRDMVFLISHSGRMAALNLRSGTSVWSRDIGSIQSPAVAGNFIFLITADQHIICMTRDKGLIKWARKLDASETAEKNTDRSTWNGPVIAGDTLVVSSSLGQAVVLQIKDGKEVARYDLPGKAMLPPIIANEMIFFLTDDGTIAAMK
jgi:outer membrane protein assembly factor BamB